MSTRLSARIFICMSTHMSLRMFIHMFIHMCTRMLILQLSSLPISYGPLMSCDPFSTRLRPPARTCARMHERTNAYSAHMTHRTHMHTRRTRTRACTHGGHARRARTHARQGQLLFGFVCQAQLSSPSSMTLSTSTCHRAECLI